MVCICEMCGTASEERETEIEGRTGTGIGTCGDQESEIERVVVLCSALGCTHDSNIACSRCKSERYCSSACQQRCWREHRERCTLTSYTSDVPLSPPPRDEEVERGIVMNHEIVSEEISSSAATTAGSTASGKKVTEAKAKRLPEMR